MCQSEHGNLPNFQVAVQNCILPVPVPLALQPGPPPKPRSRPVLDSKPQLVWPLLIPALQARQPSSPSRQPTPSLRAPDKAPLKLQSPLPRLSLQGHALTRPAAPQKPTPTEPAPSPAAAPS
ncbi:unnamed protein product [Gadus morhua 'NCC']